MANGEGLCDTIDLINTIMCEVSTNCLRPETPSPTLYFTHIVHMTVAPYNYTYIATNAAQFMHVGLAQARPSYNDKTL